MRVRVLYFGVLKDVLGREREERDVPEGSTVGEVLTVLEEGTASAVWKSLAVAVNRHYAGASTVLRDEDELALLPPVSGGSRAG